MHKSRIPPLTSTSQRAAFSWLSALHKRGLLFCLDDKPQDIVNISNGLPTFTSEEAEEVEVILDRLFVIRGNELHELAYEVLSKTIHTPAERRALKAMYG